jgi:hypothetical protein
MLNYFARFLSFIFNPVFLIIPIPYLLIVRQTGDPLLAAKWTIITLVFLLATGLSILYGVRKKYFSDLDISKREQRPLFFLLISVFSVMYFCMLMYLNAPLVLFVALGGIFFSTLVFIFINSRIKASIHVASITALIFSFSVLYHGVFLLLLFLIPLIAWSRMQVHRHTANEVIVGAGIGIGIPLVIFIVFKVLLHVSLSA